MNKPYKSILIWALGLSICTACNEEEGFKAPNEDASTFKTISHITIGGEGAAEISAYDPTTQQLFVVNNADESKIEVIDFSDPSNMQVIQSISITAYGDGVNSVAVGGDYLAAAIEADEKTDNGSIVIFNLSDLSEAQVIEAGALPDMVTFSPNGRYILSANEGEPNDDYSIDPKGSVTIVTVADFSSVTLDFTAFNDQVAALAADGFRVTGPNADLAHDVEPEYIAVSEDSKTAYVTLQENNGVAMVDLDSKSITALKALGLKNYAGSNIMVDPSNEDGKVEFRAVPANIYGVYMPDAIATFEVNGMNYLITANEGDGREYISDDDEASCNAKGGDFDEEDGCFVWLDEERIKKYDLDPAAFPEWESILLEENFGRWKAMWTDGDLNEDGLYEKLYTYGARSFSIWDESGNLVADSGDEMERQVVSAGLYDDGRSDDKGVEPEGVVVGEVNGKMIAFVGLERVDAVAVYDVSNPGLPMFLSILATGDAPEGLVFISAQDSPTGESILVVSCEDDGTIWAYSPETIIE